MKKILAMAAAAALAAGASAFADNPFSDVYTSDWAYQAVSDLSDQGIVEGYPDGTFKGQTNITRYEMAQIVARLMAKEDQYNAEQRATIDKLAAEYADELDSLGVRVSNLEKKVGNISWSGDARMRFQDLGDFGDDVYKARVRLNVNAQVNDQVKVIGRFKTEANLKSGDDAQTTMDRLHVLWQPTDRFSFDMGRTDLFLGQTGYLYDDRFEGVIAKYKAGSWGAEIGYGREWKQSTDASDLLGNGDTRETFYVQANTKVGDRVRLNAFYQNFADGWGSYTTGTGESAQTHDRYVSGDEGVSLYGIGARVDLGGQFYIDGDFIQNTSDVTLKSKDGSAQSTFDKPVMWVAGLNYGKEDLKNPGTFWMGVHYVDAEPGAYIGASTLDITDSLNASVENGAKFWVAEINYALAKNISLDGYYYFSGEYDDGTDFEDMYGIELNYKF